MKVTATFIHGRFYRVYDRNEQELDLIERVCNYEGYTFSKITSEHIDFKKYYKGGHPAIIIDIIGEDKPVVLYGFWQFVEWLLKNGMIRC